MGKQREKIMQKTLENLEVPKQLNQIDEPIARKGLCVICGDRVKDSETYIESSEGYCHRDCIITERRTKTATA